MPSPFSVFHAVLTLSLYGQFPFLNLKIWIQIKTHQETVAGVLFSVVFQRCFCGVPIGKPADKRLTPKTDFETENAFCKFFGQP